MTIQLTPQKAFYAMTGLVGLLFIGLIVAVVVGNMSLQSQSKKLESVKLENRLIEEQQSSVIKANKDIDKYAELEKVANSIVPQDKDQARSVREIVALAEQSKVPISSITFPASNLGNSATASQPTTGSSTTPAATTPSTTTNIPKSISQAVPVSGATGVYQMLITVDSDDTKPVPYSSLITFLQLLETNRRTAQVDSIDIRPDSKDIRTLTFSLGINVFLKP